VSWTRREAWLVAISVGLAIFCAGMLWATAAGEAYTTGGRSPCAIIRHVFAPEGARVAGEACRVASCESAGDQTGRVFNRWATNGQYLGLFQLGAWARSRFLHGPWFGSWANAKAALRLYRWNGHRWGGQWSCAWAAWG
jgi:hypothetical protein